MIGKYLRNGDTKSCGCLVADTSRKNGKACRKPNRFEIHRDVVEVFFNNCERSFLCDLCDLHIVESMTWYYNNTGYARSKTDGKLILFHNLIIPYTDEFVCDHINGNKLDNRRCNLRMVSAGQNSLNRSTGINNTSGHTGVYRYSNMKNWTASISKDKKTYNLGRFQTYEDAVIAREAAEIEYFGEYRRVDKCS